MSSDYATFSSTRTTSAHPLELSRQPSTTSSSLLWHTLPTSTLTRRPNFRDGIVVGLVVVATLWIALFATQEEPPITMSITRYPWSGAKRVLVTGFMPFGENKVNPSQLIATALNNTCAKGVCYDSIIVEVTPYGVAHAAEIIRENDEHDGVLMLGLENSAKGLKLEVVAQNIEQTSSGNGRANDVPLNATPAIADGPRMLATTAPLQQISLVKLQPKLQVHELWSNDAGTFACNELYYRTLYSARLTDRSKNPHQLTPTLFVHVPTLDVAPIRDMVQIVSSIAQLMVH